jgi:hypothetical protein
MSRIKKSFEDTTPITKVELGAFKLAIITQHLMKVASDSQIAKNIKRNTPFRNLGEIKPHPTHS